MPKKKGIDIDRADQKQINRINTIAKVSAQLFAEKGYLQTSMEDIAAAAKVTKGGVYHYFGSKNDILYFICSTYVEFDVENLDLSLSSIDTTEKKIEFIIFRHIEHYSTHVFAARTLLNEACNLPTRHFREVKDREKKYFSIVSGVLSQCHSTRGRKEVVTALALTLFGMMNWLYSWYDPKGNFTPKDISRLIYEVFMNGVNNPGLVADKPE
jgi:AcrR family transcriptional regulator